MGMTFISFGMHRGLGNPMKRRLAEWRRRTSSRNELQFLSDRSLRDIGVSRCDVRGEITKVFWMA